MIKNNYKKLLEKIIQSDGIIRFTAICNTSFGTIEEKLQREGETLLLDKNFSFRPLFEKYPHLGADVTDCLIGNLDRDFSKMFEAMQEFADIPEPLTYGRPLLT